MRIALLTETFLPNINGVVTTLCRLIEYLGKHDHDILLFAPEGSPHSYAGASIVPLRGIPLPHYPDLRLTPPQPGVTAQLRDFRPDIVHLAGLVAFGATACYAAQSIGATLIGAYHTNIPAYSTHYGLGFLRNLSYRYLRWIHNRCELTLCPSYATLMDLRLHGFRRLRLWRRGVDTESFHPRFRSEAWRSAQGVTSEERVLLYVGRLATEKRLDMLAEVLPTLPNTRLVLVGDGPARPGLERRLAGLPVYFTGFLQGDDLATAYASADLFVFPSDTETFGQVIQEAMASALPVLAAGAGGALDLVHPGVTGELFTPGNVQALRQQATTLLEHGPRLIAMGNAGRSFAEQRSWDHVLRQLVDYYQTAHRYRRFLRGIV